MLEAEVKKNRNIIEYVLYMFHTEDVIRSCQLNLDLIKDSIIEPSDLSEGEKSELLQWYTELSHQMEEENIEQRGHLSDVFEVLGELSYLHKQLMHVYQDEEYRELYRSAHGHILELSKKAAMASENPIELAFTGIYGVMTLKMKKEEVFPETLDAVQTFRNMLVHLGKKYHALKEGQLRFTRAKQN